MFPPPSSSPLRFFTKGAKKAPLPPSVCFQGRGPLGGFWYYLLTIELGTLRPRDRAYVLPIQEVEPKVSSFKASRNF